jgi:hypothetical protein
MESFKNIHENHTKRHETTTFVFVRNFVDRFFDRLLKL